jgi:drug/metabolite transporter (DMT)-like permease
MTYAYLNALVMLLQPYSVAVLEKFFFNSAFPEGLFPLLITSSIGSILVIYAQTKAGMGAESDSGSSYLRSRDYWAIALQFVSVLLSTASRLVARGTKKHVTRHELLIGQFGVTAVILGTGVAVIDPVHGWSTILSMPASGWGALCFLSFAVYGVGQNLNVIVIRRISATLLTSLSSVRLVMACFSSYVILNEPIINWIQWLGIAIVVCSISLYVRVQVGGSAAPSPGADVNTKSVEMTSNPVLVPPEPKV